jgi:hypothetical protein
METCLVKNVYHAIMRRESLDPLTAVISATEKANFAELINTRFLEAYQSEFWPSIMLVEQRRYRPSYSVSSNYITDDEIWDPTTELYYRSLQDNNVGKVPGTDLTWWDEITAYDTDFIAYIDFEQDGETIIGAVDTEDCLFDKDPRIYRNAGRVRNIHLLGNKILVEDHSIPSKPWLKFRPRPPQFSLTEWSGTTAYSIGDLCYLDATGETYKAITSSTNKNPSTDITAWEPVSFPAFLRNYVVHAVASDRLTEEEGRYKEEARANDILEILQEQLIDAQEPRRAAFLAAR